GNLLISLLIIAAFGVALEAYFRHTRHIARQVRKANTLLEEIRGSDSPSPEETRLRFVLSWLPFKSGIEAPDMDIFKSPWMEFLKNLHVPGPDPQVPIRSLAEPILYFNESSLFHAHVDSRLFDAMPGYLARGGILGTFIGLVAGIYLVQGGFTAGETEMKIALGQLMGGASTAFNASIVGIFLSVLFSVLEKRRRYQTLRLVRRFSELLEAALEVSPPENNALIKIHEVQQAQLAELQKQNAQSKTSTAFQINALASILNTTMGKWAETMVSQKNERSQSDQLGLQQLVTQLSEQLQGANRLQMSGLQDSLRQQHEMLVATQKNLLESNQGSLQQVGQTVRESLDKTQARLTYQQRESSGAFTDALERILGGMDQTRSVIQGNQRETQQLLLTSRSQITDLQDGLRQQHDILVSTLKKLLESNQGSLQQVGQTVRASLDETQSRISSQQRESSGMFTASLEQILAGLDQTRVAIQGSQRETQQLLVTSRSQMTDLQDGLRQQHDVLVGTLKKLMESNQGSLQQVGQTVRASLDETQMRVSSQQRESSGAFTASLEQILASLDQTRAAIQDSHRETQQLLMTTQQLLAATDNLLHTFSQQDEQTREGMDRRLTGFHELLVNLNANLREQNATLASAWSDHRETAQNGLQDVVRGMRETLDGTGAEMATQLLNVAGEFSAPLRMASTELAAVAPRLQAIQEEMSRQIQTLVSGMAETRVASLPANDLTVSTLPSRDETSLLLPRLEQVLNVLTENVAAMNQNAWQLQRADTSRNDLVQTLAEFLADFRENLRSESAAGHSLLGAVASLERATQELGNRLSSTLDKLGAGNREVFAGFHQTADQTSTQVGQVIATLHTAQQDLRDLFASIPQIVQQPLGRLEEHSATLIRVFEQLENVNLSAFQVFNEGHQTAQSLQKSQQQLSLGNSEMQDVIRQSCATFQQAADNLNQAADRVIQVFSYSSQMSEATLLGMDGMRNFAATFEQAQSRFMQLIVAMESGATMIALAGEKFESGTQQLERVASSLTGVQEIAGQTLSTITAAHEQLRTLWQNYSSRFSQVDTSLEQTFVHLNKGLTEFSERVITFIAGLDDHTGAVTEKLGGVVGEFGSKLDDLNDVMSDFLDKMSGKLIAPMHATSVQIAQAGEKIHSSLQQFERLSANLSGLGNESQEASSTIAAIPDQITANIALMHQQLETNWDKYQTELHQINSTLQQTVTTFNSDVREFSSEKVLEFVGGVDEHMDQLSTQMRELLDSFNNKLDVLNE
ncbi:MAG: hypothetical protein WCP34_12785, partial [Pseudomonadota bacterium]